mmetsp:Transcript_18401/g.51310  ORF Transcript_18401/g.51310 Transcript_18401/m.51310 type:complete len:319 (-) Transcript_18401:469-1425(-)
MLWLVSCLGRDDSIPIAHVIGIGDDSTTSFTNNLASFFRLQPRSSTRFFLHDDDDDDDGDDDDAEDDDLKSYYSYPKDEEEWDVWTHGGKGDIYRHLNCPDNDSTTDDNFSDTSFENIHTVETWKTFNRIYNEVIAATKGDPELEQEFTIPPSFDNHGFQFPIEIKFDPVFGRGVYALTDIPKSALLYISTNNGAFYNGQTYRNFLRALPANLACDVSIWAFVRWVSLDTEWNYKHMVCVDLDEGSFVNSANSDDDYNMALGNDEGTFYWDGTEEEQQQLWFGCKMKFWASRDIRAGEEIRAEYGDFVELDGWKFMGL